MPKTPNITIKKLRSGAYTLIFSLTMIALSVLASRRDTAIPASAGAQEKDLTLYAISYRDAGITTDFDHISKDVDRIRDLGYDTVLPTELDPLKKSAVILIFEGVLNAQALIRFINEKSISAVVVLNEETDRSDIDKLISAADAGGIELALAIGVTERRDELFSMIADAALKYFLTFGKNCRVFVETVDDPAAECFNGCSEKSPFTVFAYGNGVNTATNGRLPWLLTRIEKLPEWSIDEYFSSIVPH
ncbi:MAG: hypothetical protein IKS90_01005 [Clostridia bacterium]|nr:hypothetical protein [Clostridia bacterium]